MARQTKGGKYFDPDLESLETEADALACQHGINSKRIRRVFKRIAQDYCGKSPMAGSKVKDVLDNALRYLPIEEALALFEREDLNKLAERVTLTDYLTDDITPLLNLKDLACVTKSYLSYLDSNRENLIKIGRPRTGFRLSWPPNSYWLDWYLTNLYYVKLCTGMSTRQNERGDHSISYFYGDPDKPVPYENAPLIEGLTREDADRLESERAKLFDLKIGVIKNLLDAVRSRTAVNLWENCLRMLTEAIMADEVDFYLRMDLFYNGYDVKTGKMVDREAGHNSSGLTNLLEVIGHYEKEITIGTYAKTRDAVGELVKPDWLGRPRLAVRHYFQVVDRQEGGVLDTALDLFLSLDAQEQAFWTNYRRRVNEALENEFYEEVIIRTKVKRKLVHQFEPNVRTYSEMAKSLLEDTGQLPQWSISISHPVISSSDEGNVFRKEGQYWTIVYEGTVFRLEDTKGLHYIAYLLSHPRQEFPSIQLEAMLKGKQINPAMNIYSSMSDEQLAKEGLSISVDLGSTDPILDSKAKADYKRRLQELRKEREEAEKLSDQEQLEEIDEETDLIEEQLRSATGLGGRNRKFDDSSDKIRKNVTNRINSSLEKIRKEHPELWQHLRNSIKTGSFCSYNPEKDIHWSL